jgi:hypothetical protein
MFQFGLRNHPNSQFFIKKVLISNFGEEESEPATTAEKVQINRKLFLHRKKNSSSTELFFNPYDISSTSWLIPLLCLYMVSHPHIIVKKNSIKTK